MTLRKSVRLKLLPNPYWRAKCVYRLRSFLTCIVLGCVAHVLPAQKDPCPSKPDFGKNARAYTGSYKNPAYGYSTQIPFGLVGLDYNNPDYQKGFTILFPKNNGALSVYAEPNSALYRKPEAAAKGESGYLASESLAVSRHYQSSHIASRPATQSTVLFSCPGDKNSYEAISIFTLNPGGRFLYNLTWQGKASAAASATKIMQALEASWQFLAPE